MVGLSSGRKILRKTSKARRTSLMRTRAAREKTIKQFDVQGTADILQ